MLQWNESKTYTKREFCQILARDLAQFGLQKCLFRCGENAMCLKKKLFLRARFPVRRVV